MTRTEASQAARQAADHYRALGTLPLPAPEESESRPALDVVRVTEIGPSVKCAHVKNVRTYSITLKGYQWLDDNPEVV